MKSPAAFLAVWFAAISLGAARPWTNLQGKVAEAEMAGSDAITVSLKLKNGTIVPVPLASLSAADQAFVKSQPTGLPVEKRVWPASVDVRPSDLERIELVRSDDSQFIYRSASFEFISPARLLPSLVKEVARTFEATRRLVEALPWGIQCHPPDGAPRYLAVLYANREAYIAAGGPRNSGGVYMTKDKTFRIPFESLGIRKVSESYTRDDNFSNDTLVHELTHQMMHDYLPYLPKWSIEGSAEFTEMMPYKTGKFRVENHEKGLKEYVAKPGRVAALTLPHTAALMRMTYEVWEGRSGGELISMGNSRQRELYEQSALLVYYFNFLDGEPPTQGQRWMRFMDATRAESLKWADYQKEFEVFRGKQAEFLKQPGVELLGDGRFRYPSTMTPPKPPLSPDGDRAGFTEATAFKHLDLLMDGRTNEQLDEEVSAKFAKIGLKFPIK